jgi:hypothetical protein
MEKLPRVKDVTLGWHAEDYNFTLVMTMTHATFECSRDLRMIEAQELHKHYTSTSIATKFPIRNLLFPLDFLAAITKRVERDPGNQELI